MENVEFNSDGALGITVYHQNRKGSASSTHLSPQAIARTVQAVLEIALLTPRQIRMQVWQTKQNRRLLMRRIFYLFHPADVSPDEPSNWRPARNRRHYRRTNASPIPKAGSFKQPLRCQSLWQQPRHVGGLLLNVLFALQSCAIAEQNGDMERDYAYTIGRAMSDLQTPVGWH
ncbi:PmbA/TldA family metallopeptidase [Shigella sonnei]